MSADLHSSGNVASTLTIWGCPNPIIGLILNLLS